MRTDPIEAGHTFADGFTAVRITEHDVARDRTAGQEEHGTEQNGEGFSHGVQPTTQGTEGVRTKRVKRRATAIGHPWYISVNSSSERESQERDLSTRGYETVTERPARPFPPGAPFIATTAV